MKHRDGSATFVPTEGTYKPSRERDSDSKIPAPSMEEIIEEYKKVKKEHTEYLDCPLKYWDGVCITLQPQRRRRHVDVAWLFPMYFLLFCFSGCFDYLRDYFSCDCCDRYDSVVDDDYPGYDYDYEDDYGYEGDYDPENAIDEYYDRVRGESRSSEDEEEDYNDEDRSSPSPEEHREIIKQEDDKTTVRVVDGPHLPAVMEMKVDVKQEIKEGVFDGPVVGHLVDLKLEKEETLVGTVPDATLIESAAAGSGTGERASSSSRIAPDVQSEGKRVSGFRSFWNPRTCISHDLPQILRSHRSKPY